jgi:hypothetical protein
MVESSINSNETKVIISCEETLKLNNWIDCIVVVKFDIELG